jgi:hypothetical protein
MATPVRHGSFEVRLVQPLQNLPEGAPLFWMELFDHDRKLSIDNVGDLTHGVGRPDPALSGLRPRTRSAPRFFGGSPNFRRMQPRQSVKARAGFFFTPLIYRTFPNVSAMIWHWPASCEVNARIPFVSPRTATERLEP